MRDTCRCALCAGTVSLRLKGEEQCLDNAVADAQQLGPVGSGGQADLSSLRLRRVEQCLQPHVQALHARRAPPRRRQHLQQQCENGGHDSPHHVGAYVASIEIFHFYDLARWRIVSLPHSLMPDRLSLQCFN